MLLILLAYALPAAGEVTVTPEARVHFRRGVELLRHKPNTPYAEAYAAFKAAYALSPSPKILGNLGHAATKLERDGEAIEAYRRYLRDVGAVNAEEERLIKLDLATLEARVVWVRLEVQPAMVTVTDERQRAGGARVVNRYQVSEGQLRIGIHRGRHRFTVEREGYAARRLSFEAKPGVEVSKSVTLKPTVEDTSPAPEPGPDPSGDQPPEQEPAEAWSLPTSVVVVAVITGAFAVTTGVVGAVALGNKSSFDDALGAGDTDEANRLKDRGEALNVATDLLLGSTLVGVAVTGVLLLTSFGADDDSAWRLQPTVGLDRGGAVLRITGW